MNEIETLKQIYDKYRNLLMKIQANKYHPPMHQRFAVKANRAFISELKKHGWSRYEKHGFSKSGQRYFDGYKYFHHKAGFVTI